jgi:hypothetical protein
MSLVYIVCVLILLDDESFKWIDSNGTRDKFFLDLLPQLKTLSFIWMATTCTRNNMDKHFFFLPFSLSLCPLCMFPLTVKPRICAHARLCRRAPPFSNYCSCLCGACLDVRYMTFSQGLHVIVCYCYRTQHVYFPVSVITVKDLL